MELTGHRKFAVTVLAMLLASLMRAFDLIPADSWQSVMQWTAGAYIVAQAAQNAGISIPAKGSTNGTP
jgi:hypothetical protein